MGRREQLEQLLAEDPDDVFLHYALATEDVKLGDLQEGLRRFRDLNQRFPDYVPGWFKHAQVLAEAGAPDEAREVGTRGLETARRVGDLHAAGELAEFLNLLG